MRCYTVTISRTKRRSYMATLIATLIFAPTILLLSGCSNNSEPTKSDSPDVNNFNISSAELNDPNGEIAKLEFNTAEDDATYQCLLNAATSTAATRGLQAYPVRVVDRADPAGYAEGIYANWCKTVGEGNAIDNDISSCTYLNGSFSAPGTEVLQLIAAPGLGSHNGDKIERVELKSIKIPKQGSTDALVEFSRLRGTGENFFSLAFSPLDGSAYNKELEVSIGSNYAYTKPDIGLFEYYQPSEPIAEQKSLMASSAAQLITYATNNYNALKIQVEQALNAIDSLDTSAKQAALLQATTEIDRRITFINQNNEMLHRLLLEQFAIEECG